MRKAVLEISLLIAFFIGGWILGGWGSFYYIALGLILFYIFIMTLYMVGKWKVKEISWLDILVVVGAMIVWLAVAWAMIREKQYLLELLS